MLNTLMMLAVMIIQSQSPLLTDDEWLAEDWEITSRESYSISDYVEPYSVTENGISEYFVELCFTEDGEFRAAIAGDGEVVFINEDGSTYSVEIPEYRNISLSPDNYLAVAYDYDHNQYLIDGINETVVQLETNGFFFTWFINNNSQIAGIGRNCLVFSNNHGEILNIQEYDYTTGRPTFVQWSYASDGNMIVVINGVEFLIEAYSVSGGLHWSLDFPYASAGTVPLAVSADGSCTAVSQSGNGFIVLNADGEIINHYLEDYYVYSLDVSPEGRYVATTAAVMEHGVRKATELYLFDVQNETLNRIEFNSLQWLPKVCCLTDDGSLLCGFNKKDGEYALNATLCRRYVLYDISGNILYTTNTSITGDVGISVVMPYIPYFYNKGFVCSVTYTDTGYRLCYMDPANGEIVSFHIMHN